MLHSVVPLNTRSNPLGLVASAQQLSYRSSGFLLPCPFPVPRNTAVGQRLEERVVCDTAEVSVCGMGCHRWEIHL